MAAGFWKHVSLWGQLEALLPFMTWLRSHIMPLLPLLQAYPVSLTQSLNRRSVKITLLRKTCAVEDTGKSLENVIFSIGIKEHIVHNQSLLALLNVFCSSLTLILSVISEFGLGPTS